jgi:hypothetical protein
MRIESSKTFPRSITWQNAFLSRLIRENRPGPQRRIRMPVCNDRERRVEIRDPILSRLNLRRDGSVRTDRWRQTQFYADGDVLHGWQSRLQVCRYHRIYFSHEQTCFVVVECSDLRGCEDRCATALDERVELRVDDHRALRYRVGKLLESAAAEAFAAVHFVKVDFTVCAVVTEGEAGWPAEPRTGCSPCGLRCQRERWPMRLTKLLVILARLRRLRSNRHN